MGTSRVARSRPDVLQHAYPLGAVLDAEVGVPQHALLAGHQQVQSTVISTHVAQQIHERVSRITPLALKHRVHPIQDEQHLFVRVRSRVGVPFVLTIKRRALGALLYLR